MVRHASTVNMLENWSINTSNLSEKKLDDFTFEKMGAATLETQGCAVSECSTAREMD